MDTPPVRILGIAPYEGMKALMSALGEEYPQVELTLFVGDRERGLEIARANFHGNFDVVISRGGTAAMLRQSLSIPVVEIEITLYDILCALKLAGGASGRIAMVAAPSSFAGSARKLCQVMGCGIDIYTYASRRDIEEILLELRQGEYQAILCDMAAHAIASRLSVDSFLITSSLESLRSAFDQAVFLCQSQQRLRDENQFFRQLFHGQLSQTLVFDQKGDLFFSSEDSAPPELLALLRRELPESRAVQERRVIRNLGGMLYAIRSRQITSGTLSYTAFFMDARRSPLPPGQSGIRFSTRSEEETAFRGSLFGFAGIAGDFQKEIARINQSTAPVLITGEDGTGKESIVSALYTRSLLKHNPLVSINCSLLSEKSWTFLMEHHSSPLAGSGSTLYFASIDVLSAERQRQLLSALSEMEVCRRNRVLFSCVCRPGEAVSPVGSLFQDKLCCLSLHIPPLRETAERIPRLVQLTLSSLNADLPRRIAGVEPEAMVLLRSFPWPHNYTQFRRVLGELAVTAPKQTVTAEQVRQLLRKERYVGAFSPRAENSSMPLDLNRTLDQISQDVARRVLEEAGGNQTAAAKRLGISRTTLWRLLQK